MGDEYDRYECANFGNTLFKHFLLTHLKSPKIFKEQDSMYIYLLIYFIKEPVKLLKNIETLNFKCNWY
jgi:hypothetical protein